MINYSIDASVYANPFQENNYDVKEIKNYYDTIKNLAGIIFDKHPQNRKYYLFENDIKLISRNGKLDFSKQDITKLNKILKSKYPLCNMIVVRKLFDKIISRIFTDKRNHIMFDNWFNIKNIEFKDDNYPSLPDELNEKISNEDLIKNTKKNMTKIAYLNKYVYKSDKLHNIVLKKSISAQSVLIDTEFKITMTNGYYFENMNKIYYKYIIKDAPLKNININNQNVNISTLKAFIDFNYNYNSTLHNNSYIKYNLERWEEALNKAQKQFKDHVVFGREVKSGLMQYIKKIIDERCLLLPNIKSKSKEIDEIDTWMKEGPNTLFENLRAINDFISNSSIIKIKRNMNERYNCCNTKTCNGIACREYLSVFNNNCNLKCEFLEECGSNIKYFGVDCSDEWYERKKEIFVEKDRTKKDIEGNESKYWIHLKLNNKVCRDPLWFMNLRIHFRYIGNEKIEIGWIGRHLYLPCPIIDIQERMLCIRDKCPFHPKNPLNPPYDKNADELTNYLKQWPKQEPPELQEAEKSSNI